MLQCAIFADLQVNSFGIPTVRLTPQLPLGAWAKGSFSLFTAWVRGGSSREIASLNPHLRRDIGLDA